MRRILWAAVLSCVSLPMVARGDYPYATGTGYVYYGARCGRACAYGYSNFGRLGHYGPLGSVPPLGQVGGGSTIVAGRGYCPIGNGFPLDARSRKSPGANAPLVGANGTSSSSLLK